MKAEDYRETMPKDWQEGYRAAMNDAACVARELYVKHVFHTGVDGLLARCQEAEQMFIDDAEKILVLLRHNAEINARGAAASPVERIVGQ